MSDTITTPVAAPAAARRNRLAVACIALIALLPLAALLLPPSRIIGGQSERLIVLLPPEANTLPQAASVLDAADARPLGQGAWPNLWLVAVSTENATRHLYGAGAYLVLSGNSLLVGCLGFRPSLSSAVAQR